MKIYFPTHSRPILSYLFHTHTHIYLGDVKPTKSESTTEGRKEGAALGQPLSRDALVTTNSYKIDPNPLEDAKVGEGQHAEELKK